MAARLAKVGRRAALFARLKELPDRARAGLRRARAPTQPVAEMASPRARSERETASPVCAVLSPAKARSVFAGQRQLRELLLRRLAPHQACGELGDAAAGEDGADAFRHGQLDAEPVREVAQDRRRRQPFDGLADQI